MTIIELLKKILREIINFFKAILLLILGFFFKSKKETKTQSNSNQPSTNNKESNITIPGTNETLPDEINSKNDSHDSEDATNSIILELPKDKITKLKINELNKEEIVFTKEYIIELIEKELEHIYKEQKLDVKKAKENDKELKKVIEKFEEKVIPKVQKQIEFYHLNKEDEVKKEVTKIVEVELKEFPILPPVTIEIQKEEPKPIDVKESPSITKIETPNEPLKTISNENKPKEPEKNSAPYSIAYRETRELNIRENETIKVEATPILTVPNTEKIKSSIENRPTTMVPNDIELPKPKVKDVLKNTAAITATVAIKAATEILTPEKKETPSKVDDSEIKELENKLESKPETIESVEEIKKELEEKLEEIEIEKKRQEQQREEQKKQDQEIDQKQEEAKKQEEKTKEKEEKVKDLIRDSEISSITIGIDEVIEESKKETEKEDFFDKDYDRIESQIDKMLEDITNTRLRYGNKLSSKQKSKLEREESKLRDAREFIYIQKSKDIEYEQNQLSDYISESELLGLQNELKKIDAENKEEVNERFLKKMQKLEGMTEEQVKQADKRILFKKLNKASMLLEMGSILAFPFIRNRYFFYFTLGLIVDNHFNFINAFWRRKMNKYEPADLSRIRQGQDALNGALDITFKNIIELDQLEQDAISRYPELANDPRFISQVTNLRIKLNNNYNKLMHKNKVMETYYNKTRRQAKILKKDLKPEQQ